MMKSKSFTVYRNSVNYQARVKTNYIQHIRQFLLYFPGIGNTIAIGKRSDESYSDSIASNIFSSVF